MDQWELPVIDQTDQGIRLIEEERRRLARELHDGPAQTIATAAMRLDIVKMLFANNPDKALEEIERLKSRLVESVNDIRRFIFDLRPIAVDEIGIVAAIAGLCTKYAVDWKIPITYETELAVEPELTPAKQVTLYRLVQETLTNVKKHAQALRVDVRLFSDESSLRISIEDDGQGFDLKQIPPGHFGLIGMHERVAYIGGTLQIVSAIGQGSTFIFQIPMYAQG